MHNESPKTSSSKSPHCTDEQDFQVRDRISLKPSPEWVENTHFLDFTYSLPQINKNHVWDSCRLNFKGLSKELLGDKGLTLKKYEGLNS